MGDASLERGVVTAWRRRRVLVTGCTGLLGSWLTEWLVDRGADVVGLVRDRVPGAIASVSVSGSRR